MVFVDTTGSLSFPEVLERKEQFTKSGQPVLNFGPSRVAMWVMFTMRNETPNEWFLHVAAPFLREIDLYKQSGTGFEKISLSSARPFSDRFVRTTQMILPLRVKTGETGLFYLRVRSNSVLRVPLEIATMQYLFEQSQSEGIWHGLYFGLIFALLIYNLFVFISIKEKAYLYYVFYVLTISLNISYTKGYFLQFIVPAFPDANHSNFTGTFACIFLVLFTNAFLSTTSYFPKARYAEFAMAGLVIVCFVMSLQGYLLEGFVFNWAICVVMIAYIVFIGLKVLSKGFRPARYFLTGFVMLFTGIVIYSLKDSAVLPQNWFTENAYLLGSALEAIILSYALANKLNTYKTEKEESQLRELEQATLFSHQLIESQENERKRVAAELHDSLGQSLGMVKNKVLMLRRDMEQPALRGKQAADLEKMVGETIQEVRNISYNLRPLHLDLLGITQSVNSLIEDIMESGVIKVNAMIQPFDHILTKPNEINVFRIIQECCNNVIKHAQASEADLRISHSAKALTIRIADNGVGMSHSGLSRGGFGLIGIRERLKILNGWMEIEANKPHGTIINIEIAL